MQIPKWRHHNQTKQFVTSSDFFMSTPKRRWRTMSSENPPPPSYNDATKDPGSSSPSPQQTNTTTLSGGTAAYSRPVGETIYLVPDQRNQYRAYGQPGTSYVVTGQPATVVTVQDPTNSATTTTVIIPSGNCPVCGVIQSLWSLRDPGDENYTFMIFIVLL